MKIFLSWSGETSHKIALAFKEWLPCILQTVEAYVSSEDIEKGMRWSHNLSHELENTRFGILCITHDNKNAPWLLFEAGALSKSLTDTHVAPFLFNLHRSDVDGPIEQFQSVVNTKKDIRKLLITINKKSSSKPLKESVINKSFDLWYPDLKQKLKEISENSKLSPKKLDQNKTEKNSTKDILDKIIYLTKSNQRLITEGRYDSTDLIASIKDSNEKISWLTHQIKEKDRTLPTIEMMRSSYLYEITNMSPLAVSNYTGLRLILSFFKHDYPWVYDAGNEVIAVFKSKGVDKIEALTQFKKIIDITFNHPLMKDIYKINDEEVNIGSSLYEIFHTCYTKDTE